MHGPTFMGNPLACAVAVGVDRTSACDGLVGVTSQPSNVASLEASPKPSQFPGSSTSASKAESEVIELEQPVDMQSATDAAVDAGVWLRPFRNLVYAMPPYLCSEAEVEQITAGMLATARSQAKR